MPKLDGAFAQPKYKPLKVADHGVDMQINAPAHVW
jgi:hypothetical protein